MISRFLIDLHIIDEHESKMLQYCVIHSNDLTNFNAKSSNLPQKQQMDMRF